MFLLKIIDKKCKHISIFLLYFKGLYKIRYTIKLKEIMIALTTYEVDIKVNIR